MVEGIVWSVLLLVFIGLGWLGWQEYQKVESYRHWAEQFERSKYDLYAVLGQSGDTLTWGKPTRKGPVDLNSCTFTEISQVALWVNGQVVDWRQPPDTGKPIHIELTLQQSAPSIEIPFTEIPIAAEWVAYLRKAIGADPVT